MTLSSMVADQLTDTTFVTKETQQEPDTAGRAELSSTKFRQLMLTFSVLSSFLTASSAANCPSYDAVNVFIGSAGLGFGYGSVSPAGMHFSALILFALNFDLKAQAPYGPMRLGPDTTTFVPDISFRHFCGYNFADTSIRGFSHTV